MIKLNKLFVILYLVSVVLLLINALFPMTVADIVISVALSFT